MSLASLVRRAAASAALLTVAAAPAAAQILFNNGPVVDGSNRSVIRTGGTLFGAGAQASINNAVADNFTVGGGGWNVSGLSFFAYQTGAANTFTFTGLTWSVVSGDVNTGTVVASGSLAPTNGGLVGYRVTSTSLTNTDRAIFQLDADVADFSLGAGAFWLRWGITGTLASGPWQPPTSDGVVGNARQSVSGGAFNALVDGGDQLGVELPFIIRGTTTVVPEPSTWAMLLVGGVALAGFARRRRAA
jgi:hypothetical protein